MVIVGEKNVKPFGGLQGTDDEIAQAYLAKIDELFEGQGTKNCTGYVVQNWTREPYILGSYSFPGLMLGRHRRTLGVTLRDQLLFAGEHTSVPYPGYVHGAALEGRRAAVEAVSGK